MKLSPNLCHFLLHCKFFVCHKDSKLKEGNHKSFVYCKTIVKSVVPSTPRVFLKLRDILVDLHCITNCAQEHKHLCGCFQHCGLITPIKDCRWNRYLLPSVGCKESMRMYNGSEIDKHIITKRGFCEVYLRMLPPVLIKWKTKTWGEIQVRNNLGKIWTQLC